MKSKHKTLTGLCAAAMVAVGCGPMDQKPVEESAGDDTAAVQYEQAEKQTREAARAIRQYAYAERDEFVTNMRKSLTPLNEEIDQLSTSLRSHSGMVKTEAESKLQALREQSERFAARLAEVQDATEARWDEIRTDVETSFTKLKSAFEKTRQWFSEVLET